MVADAVWPVVVIAAVAAASFGAFIGAVVRLFGRRADAPATEREATAFESALVGAEPPPGACAFDAWSYRVGARFAGRVRIVVDGERVSVAGPRVPRGLYRAWIWAQALLLGAVPPALVAALLLLEPRWAVVAVAAFAASWLVSMGGAGLWPGLGELSSVDTGHHRALAFDRAHVREVDIGGKGWAKGGLALVLFPYLRPLAAMMGQRPVSFFAPDEHGLEVRYALHMTSDQRAVELAGELAR